MNQIVVRIMVTFLDLAALTSFIGSAWCLLWMMPSAGEQAALQGYVQKRLRLLIFVCLAALVVSSFSGLVQRSIEMSGVGITSVMPMLPTVLRRTHYGSIWFVRIAGIAAAWMVMLALGRRTASRFSALLLLLAGSAVAFSRSASGHPADFGDLSLQQFADWLHLLAVSSWGGSLLAIAAVFARSPVEEDAAADRLVAGIADRFYLLFGPVLAMIVFTGVYNAWVEVGNFPALVSTPYGRLLFVKLALFLFLALRYIVPPPHGQDESVFADGFLGRIKGEAILVLGILLSVSWLVHEIPSRHALHAAHAKGGAHDAHMHPAQGPAPIIDLEIAPGKVRAGMPVDMTVRLRDRNGRPLKGLEISHDRILHAVIISRDLKVFAHIHPEDLGPVTHEMLENALLPLRYSFPKAGNYLIGIDFGAAGGIYSKSFFVDVAGGPAMGEPKIDLSSKKDFGDYRVSLTISPREVRAGEETRLSYVIERNRKAITDFSPYLGAAMHLAIVPVDLKLFIHAHGITPEEPHGPVGHMHAAPPDRFGPEIEADVVFPVAGVYEVFSQVSHEGKVLLFDFMVNVR